MINEKQIIWEGWEIMKSRTKLLLTIIVIVVVIIVLLVGSLLMYKHKKERQLLKI